jgi:parvulin-like peptidyl-prolyl isomerase
METNQSSMPGESYPSSTPDEVIIGATHPVSPVAPHKSGRAKFIIAIVILLIGALVALYVTGRLPLEKLGLSQGAVAAVVNGEKITETYITDRLNQARPMLEQQGFDLNDETVMADLHQRAVDDLIRETLLIQQAKASGIEITDDDVASQYDGIVTGLGGEESFQAALSASGLSEDKLRVDLRRQLYVERFIERFASERGITVADKEIDDLYNGLKEQNESLPPIDDIRASLHNQLLQQKIAAVLNPYLDELRASADVKIN